MNCFWYKTAIIIKVYNPWVTSYLTCRFCDENVYFINMQMTFSPLPPHRSFSARADQSLFQFRVHIANATFTSEKLSFDPKTSSICWIKLLQSGPNEVISKQHNGVIELIKGGRRPLFEWSRPAARPVFPAVFASLVLWVQSGWLFRGLLRVWVLIANITLRNTFNDTIYWFTSMTRE